MADTFKIYKDDTVVAEGASPLSITGVAANTQIAAGTYKATRVKDNKESDKVDIPAFKTLPIAVTGVELTPKSGKIDIGGKLKMTVKVLPENATNKNVTFKSSATDIMTIDDKGEVSAVADVLTGESNITVTTVDGNKTAVSKIYIKTSDEA